MKEFLDEIKKILGKDFNDFLKFYNSENKEHFRGLRANTLKCSLSNLTSMLPFKCENTPFNKNAVYIPNDIVGLGNHPLHHAGAFYIQEPSAASAVTMLNVEKWDKVLDLCAAPGGKSTQIAADLNGTGLLWCNEIVKSRANILLSNIERMGVKNAVVSNCHPDTLCKILSNYFDKILVDAPCSGEGMFRKDSEAQSHWSKEHVASCAVRQLQILNSAKLALKDGGVIVYSTCTFSQEENEGVITEFLKQNPDFHLEESNVTFGRRTLDYAVRIFPMDGGEGHFAARLRKDGALVKDENINNDGLTNQNLNFDKKLPTEVIDFYISTFNELPFGNNINIISDKVLAMPQNLPNLSGLMVMRAGVLLGEIKKNRIEPGHSAFMACKKDDCKNFVDLNLENEEIKKFLHGEEISVPENIKGYTAVCVNGITTGFGKTSNGTLKNKYPKGLRLL